MRLIAFSPSIPIKISPLRLLKRRLPITMASENKEGNSDAVSKAEAEAIGKKETAKPALEPPEKPLAGDCCGSGCVRCVWDVYYDELEAYNKSLALLSNDDSKTSNV